MGRIEEIKARSKKGYAQMSIGMAEGDVDWLLRELVRVQDDLDWTSKEWGESISYGLRNSVEKQDLEKKLAEYAQRLESVLKDRRLS